MSTATHGGQLTCGRPNGALAPPLLSSHSRDWKGITVELHRFRDVDVVLATPDHVISVHVAGTVNLLQRRGGSSAIKHLTAGDVIVTPAGEPKTWRHSGEAMVIVLRLAPTYVERIALEEGLSRVELQDNFGTRDTCAEQLGKKLLSGLETEGEASQIYVETLANQLALHLLQTYSATQSLAERRAAKLSPFKLQRAIDYIDEHLRDDLTLSSISEALAMSPGHFAHALRQSTGLPPHRYVLERRIERAKSLLRQTELPITEVAQLIGCASHSHFSVLFHRSTGCSPRDYRSGD